MKNKTNNVFSHSDEIIDYMNQYALKDKLIPSVEERAQKIFDKLNNDEELFTAFNQILRNNKLKQIKQKL